MKWSRFFFKIIVTNSLIWLILNELIKIVTDSHWPICNLPVWVYASYGMLYKVVHCFYSLILISHTKETSLLFWMQFQTPATTERGALARTSPFHRTTRQPVLVLCPKSWQIKTLLHTFKKCSKIPVTAERAKSPGAPPSPKPAEQHAARVSPWQLPSLICTSTSESTQTGSGLGGSVISPCLLMLPFSVVSGLMEDFVPASCFCFRWALCWTFSHAAPFKLDFFL